MEDLDQNLNEITLSLLCATIFFALIAAIMIRFEFASSQNVFWGFVLGWLKFCALGWSYVFGRFKGKKNSRALSANFKKGFDDLNNRKKFQVQKMEEKLQKAEQKEVALEQALRESKWREKDLMEQLSKHKRTANDANQKALKSFL